MYLLDTNAVIDFCNSKLPLSGRRLLADSEPAISIITRIELFASSKITEQERLRLEDFVNISKVFDQFTSDIIGQTISIRQVYKTKLPDAIIAATTIVNGLTLVTRNTSDFESIKGLSLIDPHRL
jgi:predicted nucleic acid-binding protein